MRKMPLLSLFFGLILCLIQPALAIDDADASEPFWHISKMSGKAWIEVPGREPMRVQRNRTLYPGQTLTTADRTRLQLTHGKQRIQVGSNTVLSLPTFAETEPGHTKIYQWRGTTHLSVDKRAIKHFSVETPYMVAAVKGTQFTVSIDDERADLRVHEGVVEVKNKLADQRVDITAGQSVSMKVAALGVTSHLNSASQSQSVRMSFLDRGEEHPEIAAKRRAAESSNMPNGTTFLDAIISMLLGLFAGLFAQINNILQSSVQVVAGSVEQMIYPIFGKVRNLETILLWALAAIVVILGAGYGLYRRHKRKYISVDLSRSGI